MIDTKELLNLSREEKILLIEKLWDSLQKEEAETPESQIKETQARYERIKQGRSQLFTLEELKKNLNKLK